MLGHSHATSGALAWAGAAAALPLSILTFPAAQIGHLGTVDLLMGTFLTAGAALLPDADHPSGTISHALGPITHTACKIISTVSGGHRHATHSLAFVAAVTYGTWAGEHWIGRWFTLGLVFFLLALAVRALNLCPPGEGLRSYATIAVLAVAGTFAMDQWISDKPAWLPFSVGLGALAHLIGDCLTDRGCRLFWPLDIRTRIPIIDRTGNKVETWVVSPLFVLGTLAALWYVITHQP
ncbi:metal-dependent hydrolase [Nocardia africana]|uniref:Inner membrane protein n=1 Tax=Nocardia africana TaxID=134964 RepID=A0A378WXT7_9NOCA|nr:metal-dependent hydrolase [Nocardia africana]MCC3313496.1 metal-dependent hydrolase [Nocardia africana]SUA45133.1 inner membrane protein [Nocardia africana]